MTDSAIPVAPDQALIRRATRWLVDQHRGKFAFDGFPADCAPPDVATAYRIQDAFVSDKARACGPAVGWKIALSNAAMQRFVGLDEPVAGRLHRRQLVAGPGRVRAADYGRLLVEFEIAVEFGEDLPPRPAGYDRDCVAAAVVAVRPAFEIADDRGADYAQLSRHGLQLVADNAWNEGAVLGERRTDWRRLELAALGGHVFINGQAVGSGSGRDLMGHPLDALAWLANHASRRGRTMRRGEVAILGSLVTSKFPRAGELLRFELEGFDPLELAID
jgi:2-keto-4-pentenoate hydratase